MHSFAQKAQPHGRFGDTLVAHLSQSEANLLQKAGGSGTVNPQTGLLEFYKGTLGGRGINLFDVEETKEELNRPTVADAFQNLIKNQEAGMKKGLDNDKNGKASPRALGVAKILMNVRSVYDDKEGIYIPMYFGSNEDPLRQDPFSMEVNRELDDLYQSIGNRFRASISKGNNNDDDPDMQARDMSTFLKRIGKISNVSDAKYVENADLAIAFNELGLDLPDPDGEIGTRSNGRYSWSTKGGTPVSFAHNFGKGALNAVNERSSLNADGTGGQVDAGSHATFAQAANAMVAGANQLKDFSTAGFWFNVIKHLWGDFTGSNEAEAARSAAMGLGGHNYGSSPERSGTYGV